MLRSLKCEKPISEFQKTDTAVSYLLISHKQLWNCCRVNLKMGPAVYFNNGRVDLFD